MLLPASPTRPEGVHQRHVTVDGHRIAYTEAGSGPTLLLLHGAVFAGNPFFWDLQAALAPHARTIAPDFIGWGASDKPLVPYDLPHYERFLLGFLDALGLERVHLAGHSMGGLIGSGFALLHPERIHSLTTLAVPAAWADFEVPDLFKPLMVPGVGELMMVTTPWLGTENPLGIRRFYESLFHRPQAVPQAALRPILQACCDASAEAGHRHAVLSTMRLGLGQLSPAAKRRFRERLPQTDFPILIIAGRQDPLFPLERVRRGAEWVPRARLEILENCGHFPTWEAAPQVERFLRGVVAG